MALANNPISKPSIDISQIWLPILRKNPNNIWVANNRNYKAQSRCPPQWCSGKGVGLAIKRPKFNSQEPQNI